MPTQVLPAQVPEKAVATDTISLTEYNNFADSISELIGRAAGNLLVNGGFEVWQRGAGSFTADQAYSADRWMLFKSGGSTITVTEETSTMATNSRRSLKAVTTSTTCGVQQKVEDGYALRGKTVAITMRVHQSVASGARLSISDDVGNNGTASYSATTGSISARSRESSRKAFMSRAPSSEASVRSSSSSRLARCSSLSRMLCFMTEKGRAHAAGGRRPAEPCG